MLSTYQCIAQYALSAEYTFRHVLLSPFDHLKLKPATHPSLAFWPGTRPGTRFQRHTRRFERTKTLGPGILLVCRWHPTRERKALHCNAFVADARAVGSCVARPGCPSTAQHRVLFPFTYTWTWSSVRLRGKYDFFVSRTLVYI